MGAKQAKFTNADNSEIHDGAWRSTDQAYGSTEHDAEITVMSADGIVATVATIHCGRIRAEEITKQIVKEHNSCGGLLAALKDILFTAEDDESWKTRADRRYILDQARAAIAQIEG